MEPFFSSSILTLLMSLSPLIVLPWGGRAEYLRTRQWVLLLPNVKDDSYSTVSILVYIRSLPGRHHLFSGGKYLLFLLNSLPLAQLHHLVVQILSAVISSINGLNKVALKPCRTVIGPVRAMLTKGKVQGLNLHLISVLLHYIRFLSCLDDSSFIFV